jgi:hypothetical protein
MKIQVKVTQENIDQGVAKDICNCPIALAMQEAGCLGVFVGRNGAHFAINDTRYFCDLPLEAKEFIDRFDLEKDATTRPFTFTLSAED